MEKTCYQMLVTVKKKDTLVYWIRERVDVTSPNDLNNILKKELMEIKSYPYINNLIAMEITVDICRDMEKSYKDKGTKIDYIVFDDFAKH